MKWNQHRQTQRKRHKERRREGAGGRGCPKRIARAAVMLSFFILSPISLWPASSFSFSRSAFSYFFGLLQTKQNAKQTYFLYTEREGEGGRQRGRANTFVCKYEKFKAHTLSVLKHALIQTHIHSHTCQHSHTHTHMPAHIHTRTHTHSCRRTHVGYLMLFSIQATLFAAASAAPSRVFIFSHPLKQALESPCI